MSNSFFRITVRGVGSSAPPSEYDLFDPDNAFDDAIFEAAPVSSRASVSCPPPSGSSSRYAFVGTRKRDTLSMLAVPAPEGDVRKTG